MNDILVFKNGELELEVTVSKDRENVWLSQRQMAELFNVDRTRITRHINNIYKDGELDEKSTCAESAHMGSLAVQMYSKKIYNLDMILAVGYRVKSPNGIIFRKWATSILKDYIIEGYAVNERRLEALNKVNLVQSKMLARAYNLDEKDVLDVIEAYKNALTLLDNYDHGSLLKPKGTDTIYQLTYEECRNLINKMDYKSNVFGVEKEKGKLNGILEAVYQNIFGQDVYPSIEEKAANLLYFLIKDHPFVDGCKRIGASIFLEFLNKNNHLIKCGNYIISNDALVAITLLIAESRPEEKETMIKLVMNLLSK